MLNTKARVRSLAHAICAIAAANASTVEALEPTHILLTQDTDPVAINVGSLDGFTLRYTDEFGMSGIAPLHSLRAMIPSEHSSPETSSSMLLLVDGQRFPGSFSGASDAQDSIEWQHDGFGSLSVALDKLEAVIFEPDSRVPSGISTRDTLTLTNGDALSGFIIDLGVDATIETESGELVDVALDRVAWVRVANPPEMLEGIVVWLADGTVTRLIDIQRAGATTVELIRTSSTSMIVPLEDIVAVMMRAQDITSLASLLPTEQHPIGRPRLLEPLRLASSPVSMYDSSLIVPDLVIPAPMQIDWQLPGDRLTFSTTLELPEETAPWGNCEVVVMVDGFEVARHHMHENNRVAQLLVPLNGSMLQIRVEPGAYGPIRDSIVLRHPVLLHD
ncbi:MAG: hypothetical protein ACF8GE_08520 [Phycisphaerales bacterium JB043]